MNNKEKFDNLLQLAEFGAKRMEERRSTEFKIFISYSTLLVLVLYQLIKQTATDFGSLEGIVFAFYQLIKRTPSIDFGLVEGIILYFLALAMHAIYVMWQVGIGIAMSNDSLRRNVYLKEAERISGHIPKYYENSDYKKKSENEIIIIEHYLQQFCHLKVIWTNWSSPLLIGIPTILFIIIVYLSIQKFGRNIDNFQRIMSLVISTLLFFVIPFLAWRICKKKERKKRYLDGTYRRS